MRIGTGIDDDSVSVSVCSLNLIHQITLVIGLEQLHLNVFLHAVLPDLVFQIPIGFPSVVVGLTDAKHIQIWSVNN